MGHVKCAMVGNGSKTVAGGGPFWLEIPMTEGGWTAVLGLQCR